MPNLIPIRRLLGLDVDVERREALATLKRRMKAPIRGDVPTVVVESATRLRRLKRALFEAIGEVSACGGCAKGHPLPAGRWDGGHCCSGDTQALFDDRELVALRLGGVRFAQLHAPTDAMAGCAFRGQEGFSLIVENRPSQCLRYTCHQLDTELRSADRLGAVRVLKKAVESEMKTLESYAIGNS